MLPNLFVIGSEKCGTSSLCRSPGAHPEIFISTPKEPHFFSMDENWDKGLSWYKGLFEEAGGAKWIGEGSVSYSYPHRAERTISRIQSCCVDPKFIYCVRHPFKRIESLHSQNIALGYYARTFTIEEFYQTYTSHIVSNSKYLAVLRSFTEVFGETSCHVLFFEDFVNAPDEVMAAVGRFLGLSAPCGGWQTEWANRTQQKYEPLPIQRLKSFFGYSRFRDFIPKRLRRAASNATLKPFLRETLSDRVKDALRAEIHDDISAFLREQGKPEGYWTL
jgi:hypothetical protein